MKYYKFNKIQLANQVCNFGYDEHLNKTQVKIYLNYPEEMVYSILTTRHLPSADLSALTPQELISTEDEVENKTLTDRKGGEEEFLCDTSVPLE